MMDKRNYGGEMKRFLGVITIAVIVGLSFGVAYSQDKPEEAIISGIIPAEWGTLRNVQSNPEITIMNAKTLYFEDKNGTIRMISIISRDGDMWKVAGKAFVIKRK